VNGDQVAIRYVSIRDMAVQAGEVKTFDVKGPDREVVPAKSQFSQADEKRASH